MKNLVIGICALTVLLWMHGMPFAIAGDTETVALSLNPDYPLAPAKPDHSSGAGGHYVLSESSRDPFICLLKQGKPPIPDGIYRISELTLQGIFNGGLGAYALFRDPAGNGVPLREGDSIYDVKLTRIGSDYIVFTQTEFDPFGRPSSEKKIRMILKH